MPSRTRLLRPALILVTLLAVPAFFTRAAPAADDLDPSVSPMRGVIDRYGTDLTVVERSFDAGAASQARAERLRRFYEGQLKDLQGVSFDALDQAGRVD